MEITYENNLILVEKKDGIGIVTLNNPPMNLNSIASMRELKGVFHKLEKDPDVRVIILTGSGERAFNVGTDLTELLAMRYDFRGKKFEMELTMMDKIEFIPKPTICAIEGYCMGGGLELACTCDIRICSEKSRFAQPEITLGLYPAGGGVYRLPKLIGLAKTYEMMYTGEQIDAQEAHRLGLVNQVVPAGTAKEAAWEMAVRIARMSPISLRVIKESVRKTWQKESSENLYTNLEYIDRVFDSDNAQEGIKAFLEKRKPVFSYDC